jgi:eukaryotic-like serine/threonine-protein kinase
MPQGPVPASPDATPDRPGRVQRLVQEASALAADARAAYLERECAGDPRLRGQVEAYLYDPEPQPTGDVSAAVRRLREEEQELGPGSHVGPYRLEREVGEGGMGTVYLAIRDDDEYRKRVAVKVLRGGLWTEDVRRRFRRERQILANLDHPNIARLLDGGTTERGLPYLVMEYVEGEPIVAYADRRRLTVDDRLRLFRAVCAAVQYAHQNLTVHRDLKPSNILVGGDGVPKLLDFGIAKLIGPDTESPGLAVTQTQVRLMTPEYASPEQVRGESVTTASDVYSLGVVLYELLTGRRPYVLEGRGLREIERQIVHEEATRPSVALASLATALAEQVARQRAAHVEPLRRQLTGDLDTVVLKALHKEPSRRYASAEQLSEDVRRHLEGMPVLARPDTLGYRAGKFVRRHRVGVAVSAAFVGLLVAFGVAMAVQAARLAEERNRAQAAEALARREAETARRVSGFLADLFRVADPQNSRGRAVTAREMLDQGRERITKELDDEPLVQAHLMDTMGVVYRKLGISAASKELLTAALEKRRSLLGEEHLDTATSMNDLAEILRETSDFAAAEPLYRRALEVRRKLQGGESPEISDSLNNLGLCLQQQGRYREAEVIYREALGMRRRLLGPRSFNTAVTMSNLAQNLREQGRAAEAEGLFREVLALRLETLGEDHPRTAISLDHLARLLHQRGEYGEAEVLFRRAIAVRRKVLGEDHPETGGSINNLAALLQEKGDLDGAERLYREVLATHERLKEEESVERATTLNNLASLLDDRGDTPAALAMYRESLAIRRKRLGEDHPAVARARHNLGRTLAVVGRLEEAEALLRTAHDARKAGLGPEHPDTVASLFGLAGLMREKGDLEAAERLFRETVDLRRKILPAGHPHTAEALLGLGTAILDRGRPAEAEPPLREALDGQRKGLGEAHPLVARAEVAVGACLAALGRRAEGEPLLASGHAKLAARHGPRHRYTRDAARRLQAVRVAARATP